MKRSTVLIVLLVVALAATNAWWFLGAIDSGITASYSQVSLDHNHQALAEAIAIAPVAARPTATRADVLAAARKAADGDEGFEKEGFVWIGYLGYRFDDAGRLVELRTNWEPF